MLVPTGQILRHSPIHRMVRRKQPHPKRSVEHPDRPSHHGRTHVHFFLPEGTRLARSARKRKRMSDTEMEGTSSRGTNTEGHLSKRQRTIADGAKQVGVGLQVTIPERVPHLYNNNYTVKLTYCDNFRHDVSYGSPGTVNQIFRTNSIYDPDYTATGHQPLIRDAWASLYDYYTVLACDYEIHLYNGGTDTSTYTAVGTASQRLNCVNVALMPTVNISDYSTAINVVPQSEMKNVQMKFMCPEDHIVFKGTLTPGDFILDAKDADSDNTWTAVGSNPNIPRFIGYTLIHAHSSAITGQNKQFAAAVTVFVKLDYTVQFTNFNQVLRSVSS